MTVSTLLVCDDSAKTDQLEELIKSQPELSLTGASSGEEAADRILQVSPSLVWIELSPEPAKGLTLLGELKERYPAVQFLVSYETLKADLVKSAMQLGAIEYIDPASAQRLLPDAIERINHKLNAAIMGGMRVNASSPKPTGEMSNNVPNANYVPGSGANNKPVSTGVRAKTSQFDAAPGELPPWMLPAILVIMVIMAAIAFVVMHSHH